MPTHPIFTSDGQDAKKEKWESLVAAHAATLGYDKPLSPEQTHEVLDQVWAVFDPDSKGYIEGSMLIHWTLANQGPVICGQGHRNGSVGYTYEEMLKHPEEYPKTINEIMQAVDQNKDNRLSKEEYSAMFEAFHMPPESCLLPALYYISFIMDKPGGMDEIEAAGAEWDKPRAEAHAAQEVAAGDDAAAAATAAEAEQNKQLCQSRMKMLIGNIHWKIGHGKEYPVAEAPELLDQLEALVAQMPGGLPPRP